LSDDEERRSSRIFRRTSAAKVARQPTASSGAEGWALGGALDVEASHLALSKTENVFDRLVPESVRLPLERFAFEISHGLPDLWDDRAKGGSMKAHGLDVRTDHGPLARLVLAYGVSAMDVAAIHAVGPGDIISERGQRRRFDARDPIEVFDQAPEQGDEKPCLSVAEAAQRLAITLRQDSDRGGQARSRELKYMLMGGLDR
jgi:hypothetical protein